jgi:hypothetical protein
MADPYADDELIDAGEGEAVPAAQEGPSDEDLLNFVAEEKRQSIGLDQDADLSSEREQALNYFKGEMPDTPPPVGRSRAVSSDVSDAVLTVLPDLVEILTGGEDVATFEPKGPEDEEAARQETDYLDHVVMRKNSGFLLFYTVCQDALLSKTGVFKWWWEAKEHTCTEEFVKTADEFEAMLPLLAQNGDEPEEVRPYTDETGQAMVAFVIRKTYPAGCARIAAVPPEDFTVARDTVDLKDATYCAMRSRVRAQDLIAQGYDPELVAQLPAYGSPSQADGVRQARDLAGEETQSASGSTGDLRLVEIVEHNLRLVDEQTGEPVIWRVVTGGDERVLLHREKVDRIQFSAITPYPQTHRFYGRSLADLVLEIQRIKTTVMRGYLDSIYFALNRRMEVAEDQSNEFTIGDLLRNEPGVPVRSKTGQAVRPITDGGFNVDAPGALEYFSTVAEQRTGIVRNAQGLNPDTLHDTASGAQALMGAAQKRVRMIARVFAETGVKDMFLGVHAMLRTHPQRQAMVRLRGKWVAVDPTTWGERDDMSIEIGVGSGGQAQELQIGQALMATTEKLVGLQGGLNGPFVQAGQAYAAIKRFYERSLKIKNVDAYLSDPSTQPQQEPQAPPPNPDLLKAQMEAETKRYEIDQKAAIEREKMAVEDARERDKMTLEAQLKAHDINTTAQVKTAEAVAGIRHNTPPMPHVQFGGAVG